MIVDATATPAELLETGARLSRRFGEDPEYSRAGGGNSSVKHDGTLYIKPSGVSLASIRPGSLMPLAMGPLLALAGADAVQAGSDPVMRVAMAARLRDEGELRPSVECVFHALIPRRFVIHTHPTTVNALTCASDGEAIARDLFGDDALWIPYTDPGLPLAREIARRRGEATRRRSPAEMTLLQNHGLIVAGDDRRPSSSAPRRSWLRSGERIAGAPVPQTTGLDGSAAAPAAVEHGSRVVGEALGGPGGARAVAFDASPDAAWVAGTREGRALVEAAR